VCYPVPEVVPFHRMRLRQVLLNLASNAVKFTSEGSVTIRAACSPDRSQLVIEVRDTGIGMTPELLSRLFQSFVQASASTASKYGGTGLGLVISKQLVELMGGKVNVESTLGQGTTMRVTLPIDNNVAMLDGAPAPKMTHAASPVSNVSLSGRVLLVEDSPDIQRLIAFVLGRAGATVETAADGKVALDMALDAMRRRVPFDLVLTDLDLPGLNGLDLVRALRVAGFGGKISALSAHSLGEQSAQCLEVGCDDYIVKPIDRATFLPRIAAMLDSRATKAA